MPNSSRVENDEVSCPSEFALPVQNRFAALDPTVRDSSGFRPTSVDGSGVEAFPMTDDAAVEPSGFDPAISDTPQSIQDRQYEESDELHGNNSGTATMVAHNSPFQSVITTREWAHGQSPTNQRRRASIGQSRVPRTSTFGDDRRSRSVREKRALTTMDDVDPVVRFRQRAAVMKTVPHFLRGPQCIEDRPGGSTMGQLATWSNPGSGERMEAHSCMLPTRVRSHPEGEVGGQI